MLPINDTGKLLALFGETDPDKIYLMIKSNTGKGKDFLGIFKVRDIK
jgi:hypothetical protein